LHYVLLICSQIFCTHSSITSFGHAGEVIGDQDVRQLGPS